MLSVSSESSIEAASVRNVPWPVVVFLVSIVIPIEVSVNIFGLFITLNRAVLLLLLLPLIYQVIVEKKIQLMLFDYLLGLYAAWMIFSMIYHHGLSRGLESGGITALEATTSYLLARCYITNLAVYLGTAKLLAGIVFAVACVSVPEMLSGKHIVHDFFGSITGYHYGMRTEVRLGFTRAFGPMNHPILLGVFCSSIMAMVWCNASVSNRKKRPGILVLGGILAGTFSSLSSAPFLLLFFQGGALIYNKLMSIIKRRWILAFIGFLFVWVIIDVISNRGPLQVMFTYLLLNSQTGYMRQIIWDYGSAEVWRHPLLGIGFNEWMRPYWVAPSIDNFWLVTAVRHGLTALLALAGAIFVIVNRLRKARHISESPELQRLRLGWVISFLSLCLVAATVHLWNAVYVYFFFMLGMGVWMLRSNAYPEDEAVTETECQNGEKFGRG